MRFFKKLFIYGFMFLSVWLASTVSAIAVGSEATRALAEQGDMDAQYQLCSDYIWAYDGADLNKSFDWCLKAAKQGHASAQFSVGQNYYFGPSTVEGPTKGQGVSQNYYEAFKWFEKAANQGNSEASLNLGSMYLNGYGVRQDHAKAIQWFKKADNASGEFRLGFIYKDGEGVNKDRVVAKEWFGKACDRGYQRSCDFYRELNEVGY